jgi:ABC-type branched-subunit amino acid transport system substrate-binding protein
MDRSKTGILGLLAVVLIAGACSSSAKSGGSSSPTSGGASTSPPVVKSSRGFDGTTIKVAGLGYLSNFAGADIGTQARFKRFNDTNEIPGIKIQFLELADDKGDPATAISEARRLVTQDQVFAIVPDLSPVNPGAYLAAQHVPYVGWAFDASYCTTTPSTSVWGFGYSGCLVPPNPPAMPLTGAALFTYVGHKTGKTRLSAVVFSADDEAGKNAARTQGSAMEGSGFDVVYAKGSLPAVVSDYSPYVQRWLSADGGKQPDVIDCLTTIQCIPIWAALKAAGYTGTFFTPLGAVDALAKPLAGTVTLSFYSIEPNAGLTQLSADLEAFKPGTKPVSYANVPAYFAADMFIQSLKKVGRDITPEALQKALATQTWQIPGLVGPIRYPDSSVIPTPTCIALLQDNPDGSGFTTISPYTCSDKRTKIDPKFSG